MHLGFPRIKGNATLDIMLPGYFSRMPSTGANKLHLVLYTEIGTCSGDYFWLTICIGRLTGCMGNQTFWIMESREENGLAQKILDLLKVIMPRGYEKWYWGMAATFFTCALVNYQLSQYYTTTTTAAAAAAACCCYYYYYYCHCHYYYYCCYCYYSYYYND